MPEFVKQHYLPAVYLQNFCVPSQKPHRYAAIWRFDGVDNTQAQVENQCFQKYGYSKPEAASVEKEFGEIEGEIFKKVQDRVAANSYGIEIRFLGIKKLGLPESVTQNVFERMQSERQVLISQIQFEGEEQATKIKASADRESAKLLADAEAEAPRGHPRR